MIVVALVAAGASIYIALDARSAAKNARAATAAATQRAATATATAEQSSRVQRLSAGGTGARPATAADP